MKKNKNKSITSFFRSKKFVALVGLPVLTLVLVFIIALQEFRITQLERTDKVHNNFELSMMILRAVDGLRKPTVEESVTAKQYISDARLVLPPRQTNVQRASFSAWTDDDGSTTVSVSSNADVDVAKASLLAQATTDPQQLFDKLPRLQACARGVQIIIDPSKNANLDGYGKAYDSKQLANGKRAYFYMEDACKNDEFLAYVKNVDSY